MSILDLSVIKKKKIDAITTLTVSQNLGGDRLVVEFATNDGRLRLEKSFTAYGLGMREAQAFQATIRSTEDLYKYFGLTKEEQLVIRCLS